MEEKVKEAEELAVLMAKYGMELFIAPLQIQIRPKEKKEDNK